MFIVCPVNALILKWYAEDFVICASNVSLQSCKLYSTTKFVKIITYRLFVIGNFTCQSVRSQQETFDLIGSNVIQQKSSKFNGKGKWHAAPYEDFFFLQPTSKHQPRSKIDLWYSLQEICHFGLQNDLKGLKKDLMAMHKSRKFLSYVVYTYLK